MADHIGAPGGRRSGAGESDPFAELTRIIGFDPRVRVHKPAAGAATPSPEHALEAAPAPMEPAQPASAHSDQEADIAWEQEFESLDLDLDGGEGSATDEASEPTADAAEQQSVDVAFDDEEWQRAVAASLSALDAEPEEGAAPPREDVVAAGAPDEDVPRGADVFEDDRALFDAPLEFGESDWDLASSGLASEAFGDVPADAEETDAEPLPVGPVHLAEAEHVTAEIDLDHVLAASIERELEEAWTTQGAPEPDEGWAAAELLAEAEAREEGPAEPVDQPAAMAMSLVDRSLDFEDELAALLTEQDIRSADTRPTGSVPADVPAAEASIVGSRDDEPAEPNPVDTSAEPVRAPAAASPAVTSERLVANAPAEPERPAASASPEPDDDPFAALAAMAARYRAGQGTSSWRKAASPAEPKSPVPPPGAATANAYQEVEKGQAETMKNDLSPRHHVPEIETVDVNEHAVAFTDDLDVPEMAADPRAAARPAFDDLDTEFAELLNEMSENGRSAQAATPALRSSWQRQSAYEAYDERSARPAPRDYRDALDAPALDEEFDTAGDDRPESDWQDDRAYAAADDDQRDDVELDPSDEPARGRKRGTWLAALFGSVALVGGVGAYALQNGGPAASGEPVLITADAGPLKVKPENPGGTQVPNQNNTVYERVAGAAPTEPAQGQLMASSEEPVDLVARELEARAEQAEEEPLTDGLDALNSDAVDPDAVEAPKEEDRIAALAAEEPVEAEPAPVVVEPRKVRTMVVRSDGTLVPRDEPAIEEPVPVVQPAVEAAAEALRQTQAGSMAQAAAAADRTASVTPEPAESAAAAQPAPSADSAAAEPVQMAALAPGSWSMQIASQPSEADAKSTYQDLARRYDSVLGGRPVSIVKAEIAGKGTFWRVRIPAETRDDAVSMCSSYKAAGGNCFVSK